MRSSLLNDVMPRVVSPEISSGKFPLENLIFPEISGKFPEIFISGKFQYSTCTNLRNYIFTFYRLLQHISALILTLNIVFVIKLLIDVACMVSLRIFTIGENFRKFPPRTKFPENLQP